MMKILLIEDDQHKSSQVTSFLENEIQNIEMTLKKSYQSGLKEILSNDFDLILLDMQLPNFDIKPGEDGYKFRKLAGLDILEEVERKEKDCKILIITQFETFGEGESYIDLNDLKHILKENHAKNYIDTVFYSPENSMWQSILINLIKEIFNVDNFNS